MVLSREGDAGHTVEDASFYAAYILGALLKIVPFDSYDAGAAELIEWVATNS
jgi:hypothetical protein